MISCMPHNSRFHRKLTKEVTQFQCWNGTQERGHKKANDLSHKLKVPKMQQNKTLSINLTAANVRVGTLVKQDKQRRREHTSIKMT